MLQLDIGVRLGAWQAIADLKRPHSTEWNLDWLGPGAAGRLVEQLRIAARLTVEALAAKVDVQEQAVDGWRSGRNLPTNAHIQGLASALVGAGPARQALEFRLRLLVAVQDIRTQLEGLCGEDRIADMVDAMILCAKHTNGLLCAPLRMAPKTLDLEKLIAHRKLVEDAPRVMVPRLWNLVLYGAGCPVGEIVSQGLAEVAAFADEVAADFQALPGDWTGRIQYWMHELGAVPRRIEYCRDRFVADGTMAAEDAEKIAGAIGKFQRRMSDFDRRPPDGATYIRVSPPPHGKAMNRLVQAERAHSIGDLATAVEHLRHAVKHQPENAGLRFKLGCALWQFGWQHRRLGPMKDGLLECRLAVQLDPEFGNARNEVAIILSNLRRHEEAEAAFAEAEPYYGDHAHHWFTRGCNYLGLRRAAQASVAFEKAIALSKDNAHVPAMARLAATYMALGRIADARRLGNKVAHLTGRDPTVDWQAELDVWADEQNAGAGLGRPRG